MLKFSLAISYVQYASLRLEIAPSQAIQAIEK